MRIRRSKADWQQIIEEQKESGKSANQFCKERGITPSHFYQKRKAFHTQNQFVRLNQASDGTQTFGNMNNSGTCITIGTATIYLSRGESRKRSAEIVRGVLDGVYAGT